MDRSTNGNDFTASGTYRPTYRADGGAEWNNGPVLEFTTAFGSAQGFNGPNLSALTAGEAFFLIANTNDPAAASVSSILQYMGTSAFESHVPFTDGNIYDDFGSTVRKTVGNPTPSFTSPRIYNVVSASGDWSATLDGSSLHSTGTNTVGFPAAPMLGIGKSLGNYFLGEMKAFLLYDGKLSSGDRTAVYDYLDALRA